MSTNIVPGVVYEILTNRDLWRIIYINPETNCIEVGYKRRPYPEIYYNDPKEMLPLEYEYFFQTIGCHFVRKYRRFLKYGIRKRRDGKTVIYCFNVTFDKNYYLSEKQTIIIKTIESESAINHPFHYT